MLPTFVIGLREGLGRVLTTSLDDVSWTARLREYAAILDLWQRFPLLGSGLATFRDAFPQVQPRELQGTWWHAHSDLLELLATTGAVGIVLLVIGLWPVPLRLVRVIAGRDRSENRATPSWTDCESVPSKRTPVALPLRARVTVPE